NECSAARPAEAKTFIEAHQMRRGVDVHIAARGFENSAHECDHRALAIGATDVNERWQAPLGMVEPVENPPHAGEGEIDLLGVKREQACENGVDGGHRLAWQLVAIRRTAY